MVRIFLGELLTTFAVVFSAELPDKTMFTTLVLTTRFRRPALVWSGAACAFVVHATIAVTAGRLVSLLPDKPVKFAVAALFAIGAIVLWRNVADDSVDEHAELHELASARRIWTTSFGLLLVAEWGDLTQLSMASLSASSSAPGAVFVGGLAALWAVAAIAATTGGAIVKRVPVTRIRRIAACIFAGLAVFTLVAALRA